MDFPVKRSFHQIVIETGRSDAIFLHVLGVIFLMMTLEKGHKNSVLDCVLKFDSI